MTSTGEFTALTTNNGPLTVERFADVVDIELEGTNLYVLTPNSVQVWNAGFPSISFFSGVGGGTSGGAVVGADRMIATAQHIHFIDTDEDRIATYHRPGGLTFLQQVQNGVNGVGGLDEPVDIVESLDGSVAFAFGRNSNAISVFHLDGSGVQDQKLTNNAGGVTGFVRPIAGLIGLDGKSVIGATSGDDTVPGGLVTFERVSGVGNELIARPQSRHR